MHILKIRKATGQNLDGGRQKIWLMLQMSLQIPWVERWWRGLKGPTLLRGTHEQQTMNENSSTITAGMFENHVFIKEN